MPSESVRTLTGRCKCGTVQYAVADAFQYAMNCHCSQCRHATGSAFKPIAGVRTGMLQVMAGAAEIMRYGDPAAAHDVHCRKCGSFLYSVVRNGEYAHVLMGGLVDAPSIRPTMNIFVGSKADWYDIADDLPQFEALPPSW